MTQQDSLLPWRSAVDNVMLPLILKGMAAAQARAKALAMLERVGIERFARHFPSQLSGGMRKRASLAQLLVQNPSTILMDEPFGALDAQLKVSMQKLLLSLWEGSGKTLVFVTHDLAEAITLADQIVVFSGRPGQIRSIESSALPRPRDAISGQFSPRFQALYQRLWSLLAPDVESALTGGTS
jgi:NitT/TauT family transport system ATP-binding protein